MVKKFIGLLLVSFGCLYGDVAPLQLRVISYEGILRGDRDSLEELSRALHEEGVVGVRGVPGYGKFYQNFIEAARAFSALPEDVKEGYKPNREAGDTFLGYESGKEKFQTADGQWVVDDLKTSFYARVPNVKQNKWPKEVALQKPFQELGTLMSAMGELIMEKIGLLGPGTGFALEEEARLGRMLYYRKSANYDNPRWCGAHFDHGLFTALVPAAYFVEGERVEEPEEAGLFVRVSKEEPFRKVIAEEGVMLFQVGEFGQLATSDGIKATEHYVHKSAGAVERYTLALFYDAPMDVPIYSRSVLTNDPRYNKAPGEAFTYREWNKASFERYLVKEEE